MTKSVACADGGSDCGWSATADTEKELMEKCKQHAQESHKGLEMTPEVVAKIKSCIKDI